MMKRFLILALVTVTFTMAGCGVKPNALKPPKDTQDIYPSTYPHPEEIRY